MLKPFLRDYRACDYCASDYGATGRSVSSLGPAMARKSNQDSDDANEERNPAYVVVGDRLLRALKEAGFDTQVELAEAAKVRPLTINRVVKGRGPLTRELAEKLAPLVNKTVVYLLFGIDSGAPRERESLAAVRQYLTDDPYGKEASPRIRKLLEALDFASIGIPSPSLRDVRRAHEWIEFNVAIARQQGGDQ